jgi:hypothetical protein
MSQGFTRGVPIDTDPTLSLDSDLVVPSQKAIKAYVDNQDALLVSNVTATAPLTSSGGTTPVLSTSMTTNKLIGRSTAGTGVMEEITIGSGLSLSAGTLSAAGGTSATIGVTIDGSGGTITSGIKGYVQIPYACTINSWRIIATVSGSTVIDVWKTASPTIPTVANTITGTAKPTLSVAQTSASSTLTGWTTAIAANDILAFNVDSATTVSWVILQLFVTKL